MSVTENNLNARRIFVSAVLFCGSAFVLAAAILYAAIVYKEQHIADRAQRQCEVYSRALSDGTLHRMALSYYTAYQEAYGSNNVEKVMGALAAFFKLDAEHRPYCSFPAPIELNLHPIKP
jgi:hypothetical protein